MKKWKKMLEVTFLIKMMTESTNLPFHIQKKSNQKHHRFTDSQSLPWETCEAKFNMTFEKLDEIEKEANGMTYTF